MNYRAIAIGVLIVMGLTFVGGFAIGLAVGKAGLDQSRVILAMALLNLVLAIIAFCIAGALVKADRFNHLMVVAFVCWILSAGTMFINPRFTLISWFVGLVFTAITMVAGWGLSLLLSPVTKGDVPAS